MAANQPSTWRWWSSPRFAAGDWVVSDRYAASTIAYQGYGRGLEPTALADVVAWATGGVSADLSVLVDVPVDVASARLAVARGRAEEPDRLERLGPAFAARVREGFLAQTAADPGHWVVVDGRLDAPALTAHIVAAVHARFGDAPLSGGERRATGAGALRGGPGPGGRCGHVARRRRKSGPRVPVPGRRGERRVGRGTRLRGRPALPGRRLRRVRHVPGCAGRHRSGSPRRAPERRVRLDRGDPPGCRVAQRRPLPRGR